LPFDFSALPLFFTVPRTAFLHPGSPLRILLFLSIPMTLRRFSLWSISAIVALASSDLSAAVPVEGFSHVKTVRGISEYTLKDNGLTVLLMPEHSAPVVTFMVTYLVGSRNEVYGTTGATHLLEHLMFKGSKRFNQDLGNGYDQTLDPRGAENNATTWFDRTNYYVNSPSDHLAKIVELEADRMRGLLLRESDRQPEMTVVRNEYERGENDPFNVLLDQVGSVAFLAHPYHHPTIGWRSDIEGVSIDKLREFYDTFYWPNNATVSVIGDFDPAQALQLIGQHYRSIPRSPHPIPEVYTVEPKQDGPRRLVIKRAGELGVVDIAHKICPGSHRDFAAVSVLSTILATGKNSRLYRALTDPGLSTGVQAIAFFHRDPTLHHTMIPLAPNVSHEEVEQIALAEIDRVKAEGVADAEVAAAISQLLANMAYGRDGSFAIAGALNEHIAVGDWSLYYALEDATRAVNAADVKRVANLYFIEDSSTTGWFVPIVTDAGTGEIVSN
jgi:zinc protease